MGVNLGSSQVCMSQYFFDGVQVSSVVQHVCCESVPDNMRAALTDRSNKIEVMIDHPINHLRIKFCAFISNEQLIVLFIGIEYLSLHFEIVFQQSNQISRERYYSFLIALAGNFNYILI